MNSVQPPPTPCAVEPTTTSLLRSSPRSRESRRAYLYRTPRKDGVVVVALSRRLGRPIRPLPERWAAARAVSVARPRNSRPDARPQAPPGRPWPWPPRAHRPLSLLAVPRRRRRGRGPQHRQRRHPGHRQSPAPAYRRFMLSWFIPSFVVTRHSGSCLGVGITTYVRTSEQSVQLL